MHFHSQLFTLTSDKTDSTYEDTRQDNYFDVILCVFVHLSAPSFACTTKLNLVLAARALDVTVSAQKSTSGEREYRKA